jgi:protocatechuate 3,4-dioxygenase beta subunit
MKAAVAAVVAVSVLVGIVLWRSSPEPMLARSPAEGTRPAPALAHDAAASSPAARTPAVVPAERASGGRRSSEAPAAEPTEASTLPPPRVLRGRVLDVWGLGLPGVELALGFQEHATAPASKVGCTSGANGWFELPLEAPAESIVSADARFATALAGSARVRDETQAIVVVAPRIELAGIVVDEHGSPLAGAFVDLRLPAGFGSDWGLVLDYTVPQRWFARGGDDGRFAFPAVPAVNELTLRALLGGYEAHVERAPTHSDRGLEIALVRPRAAAGLLRGVVLDPSGAPVQGARVSAGAEVAFTEREGEFALDLSRPGTRPPLIALKRGFQLAKFEPENDSAGAPAWPGQVVLQLGAPPSAIHGRVVDDDRRPVAAAKVWLDDPTPFGEVADNLVAAESLLRGDERFWSFAETQADGSFVIDGLMPRAYRLQAIDPVLLTSVESPPLWAGDSPVELVPPTRDVHERVAGRVVTRGGEPLPGASVQLLRITYQVQLHEGHQNDGEEGQLAITDEDGAFEFHSVPKEGVDLLVTGDTILFTGTRLAQERDVEDIEIVASQRMHLQVELVEPYERADRLCVLDTEGERMVLSVMQGEGASFGPEMPLLAGRSAILSLDDSAATLVLYRGEEEVGRLPLHLVPGAPNVVQF